MKGGRYYRESSRFSGIACDYDGKSVRAADAEAVIDTLIQGLKLPQDWQEAAKRMLVQGNMAEDNEREKLRLRTEIRRMRAGYKHGLYEGEEFVFWREIESMQAKSKALEQVEPSDISKAADSFIEITNAWQHATREEQQELVKIPFEGIRYDFEQKRICAIQRKPEYAILFGFMDILVTANDGFYYLKQ